MTGAWRSGPLSIPAFRLLTAGQFTSTLGDYCYAVALPWLVLSGHGSAAVLGIILACYGIPRAALATLGGSLADRIGPRTVMLCADGARCALTALFAVFAADHVTSLAALAPVAAVLGGCSALFLPASYAIMPSLLAAEQLPTANAIYNTALQAGALLGPVLGGAAVAAAGPAMGLGIDAASYAISAASLGLIRSGESATAPAAAGPEPERSTPPGGIWKLLLRERILQFVLLVTVVLNFAAAGTEGVALPALSHARFGAAGYGAILACFGAGSITGTLAAARFGRLSRPALVAGSAFLAAAAAIAGAPFGGLPAAAAAMLVFGLVAGFGNVVFITLIQQWAPPTMLGRVMGLVMLAAVGSFPLSTTVAGVLTTALGPSPVFVISGTLIAAAVLAGLAQREFRAFGAHSQASDASATSEA